MNRTLREERFKRYLDTVCLHIRAKDRHEEIRLELSGHLEDIADRLMAEGMDEDEAIRQAIRQMGDPRRLGLQLHRVHKPKTEWSLVILALLLIGFAIVAMYAVQEGASGAVSRIPFMKVKILLSGLGVVLMAVLYFIDYRKLRTLTWYLYGAAVLLLIWPRFTGYSVSSQLKYIPIGSFNMDVTALALYLFMAALAGFLSVGNWDKQLSWHRIPRYAKESILFFAVPGYLYLADSSFVALGIHCFGVTVMILAQGQWRRFLAYIAAFTAAFALFLQSNRSLIHLYYADRVRLFLDPSTRQYFYLPKDSLELIRSAGFWGRGIGHSAARLPYFYNENLFSYLIYVLGWGAGLLLVAIVVLFLLRSVNVAKRASDPFARALVIGLSSILAIKFGWSLLMSVGILPYIGVEIPLIGYNGVNTVVELSALGILLSVYRRKDSAKWSRDPIKQELSE